MRGRSLTVLMWKHLMVRKRKFIYTAAELVSPLLFIFVLFLCRNRLNPKLPQSQRDIGRDHMVRMTEEKVLDEEHGVPPLRLLLYTPDTKLAGELMDEVGAKLGHKRLNTVPIRGSTVKGYYAYSNVSEIADLASNLHTNQAIVIFEDMEADDWADRKTDKLVYTIRIRKNFDTYSYMSWNPLPKASPGYGLDYQEFMLLQWTIDTSYIKIRTGKEVPQKLSLQEFPYYDNPRAKGVDVICEVLRAVGGMSLFLPFVFLMSRLLEERATGIQELIKMMGVSSNTLGLSHFLNALPTGLMYAIMSTVFVKVSDNPLIPHSDGGIIFIAFLLHFVAVASMAMACSYISLNTQYTTSVCEVVYILLWLPSDIYSPSHPVVLVWGLLPHVPMHWLWKEISAFETYNEGLTFENIMSSHSSLSGPVMLGFGWMMGQSALFFFITWYLSYVKPGKYGQALPWNFLFQKPIFQKQFWTQNEIKPATDMDEEELIAKDNKYFEDTPKDMTVGIKIENISKFFSKHKALRNVSLDVYKGEITILLGHNGAGKTTLMSIITGMMTATEGKIYVNGMDAVKQRDQVRKQVGLCPQHNLFFPDLTVLEHTMFFALLKGDTYSNAHDSSMALLNRLGISEKAHSMGSQLSGGMQRRLQLACALSGGASVLVLDEPTSGLDVETRRELWDLLLSLRGERTVLLTTHFMEEADALGDRVAALHSGQLRCHATPMYLKKAIGTGYRLSFTTNGTPRDGPISSVVTSFVPDATIKEKTINSLSYNLPATSSNQFPNLFTTLEDRKSELGIETIGVGVSTLEEVFLKLCSDTDTTFTDDEVDTGRVEPTYNKVVGMPLYLRQLSVLFKRQYKYIASKAMLFIVMQALIPIVIICAITATSNNHNGNDSAAQPSIALNLDLYRPMAERKVLYDVNARGASIDTLNQVYPKVEFSDEKNITNAVLRTGKKSLIQYNKYLVGIELSDSHAKALFTTVYRHAAPVAMNLLSNLIASQYLQSPDGRAITTLNHPVDSRYEMYTDPLKYPKDITTCITWTVLIGFIILAVNSSMTSLPCSERISGSRHLHIMAGCPAALHWLCTLTFHIVVCVVLLVIPTAIAALTLDTDSTLAQTDMILTLMLALILGSLAFFAVMYLVTFYLPETTSGVLLVAITMIFGVVTPAISTGVRFFSKEINIYLDIFLRVSSYIMPPHAMTVATAKCVIVARSNALCTLNKQRCPNLFVTDIGFDPAKCCAGEKSLNYFDFSDFSPGAELLFLLAQLFVYMTLVVLTQNGIFNRLSDRIFNMKLKNRATVQATDEIVRAEAVYVDKEIALPKKQIEEAKLAMLVNNVHKNYYQIFRKSCYAVQGLSFSVKKGECFGLLGVNGAGKSTTFKMLTTEECCTKGDIYANGRYINKEKGQYLRTLGYCPQFFGLDDFQTGADNLKLLLTLRGLDAKDVDAEVKSWIDVVGLEKYSRSVVSSYSGGCTRRLGAAAALCSGAPLTLLDEPTAGVDVAARRRVWNALRRTLALQRSIVITSHSMDEMEALCSRIGIMSGGVLRALGTPAELRARHAQGHAVLIKVKHAQDEVDGGKSEIDTLKNSLHTKFNCTLKDEHKTMLHYHINETMRYSDLFSELENLKTTYPNLVEDYSVTETTLEEVFLSFARENQQEPVTTQNGIVL